MECVIRLLWDCMYGVEKTAVEWRLKNCGKVNKYLNTSPVDWFNFEDQRTFSKLAKEAFEFDFESEEEFTLCASPPFDTLSTNKLKEIVLKAKTTFKW